MNAVNLHSRKERLMSVPKDIGSWLVVIVLLLLLAATGFVVYEGLRLGDLEVPASGYVAMALGVTCSLVVGFGLMALLFYSSRKGYDEPAALIKEPKTGADPASHASDSE
jgi:hypothetical protein